MKAVIDKDACTGCGLCTSTCPRVFELEGDKAKVKVDEIPEDAKECAREAERDCPLEAIKISE